MGATFVCGVLAAPRGKLEAELQKGLERAKKLSSIEELPDYFLEQWIGDDSDYGDASIDNVRELLVGAFSLLLEACEGARFTHVFSIGEHTLMVSGGASWGDPPTQAAEAMFQVSDSGLFWKDRSREREALLESLKSCYSQTLTAAERASFEQRVDELVHEAHSTVAANINNRGIEAQLTYLAQNFEPRALLEMLEPISPGASKKMVRLLQGDE